MRTPHRAAVGLILVLVGGISLVGVCGSYVLASRDAPQESVEARVVTLAQPGEELGVVEVEGVLRPALVVPGAAVGSTHTYLRHLERGTLHLERVPRDSVHEPLSGMWMAALLGMSLGVSVLVLLVPRLGRELVGGVVRVREPRGDDGQP